MIVSMVGKLPVMDWLMRLPRALALLVIAALTTGGGLAGATVDGSDRGPLAVSDQIVPGSAAATVILRPTVKLPGMRYTLGDVADVRGTDPALVRRLAALPVGVVPRLGYAHTVSQAEIQALARQAALMTGVVWAGAGEVRVRGQGQTVAAQVLTDAAAQVLFAEWGPRVESLSLQPVGDLEGVNVPAGSVRVAARMAPAERLSRRMSALVDVSVDGAVYTTVPAWFSVRAARPALVARVALRAGDVLRPDYFSAQTVDVADEPGQALASNQSLAGLRLRRALQPGSVLTALHVEPRPSVGRDERVAVRVVQGAVVIETTGRALSEARVGEVVKVSSAVSSEPFLARVVGDGVVAVGAR